MFAVSNVDHPLFGHRPLDCLSRGLKGRERGVSVQLSASVWGFWFFPMFVSCAQAVILPHEVKVRDVLAALCRGS